MYNGGLVARKTTSTRITSYIVYNSGLVARKIYKYWEQRCIIVYNGGLVARKTTSYENNVVLLCITVD